MVRLDILIIGGLVAATAWVLWSREAGGRPDNPDLESVWFPPPGKESSREDEDAGKACRDDDEHIRTLLREFSRAYREIYNNHTPEYARGILLTLHVLTNEILTYATDLSYRAADALEAQRVRTRREALRNILDQYCRDAAERLGMPGVFPRPL